MNKESATTTPSSLLSGLRALITGGSQGIGRAIAESFSQAVAAARKSHPNRISFVIRIGHEAALHLGGVTT